MRSITFLLIMASVIVSSAIPAVGSDSRGSDIRLREAVDLNPDPHVVEVNLETTIARVTYAPHQSAEVWTYNGDIPGPLIRAHVNDRVIVHFKNNLPSPTTVHWHGVRLNIEMDGVPGISQPEVPAGGTFTYEFVVPDAGLFWYHPHVMSATQVGYGLYGALLVEKEPEIISGTDELVLVLSDIALEDQGTLMRPSDAGGAGTIFGLEGNHVLVNGRERPQLTARAGVPQRWRIVNAAKSRYFELDLPGPIGSKPFTLIGRDGGLQEFPTKLDTLLVTPGERADVIVTPPGNPGSTIMVRSIPHDRGYGSEYFTVEDLFTIAFDDSPRFNAPPFPAIHRTIEPIDVTGANPVRMDITLVQPDPKTVEYRINDVPATTMKPVQAKVGETQIWTITNQTKWSHPIHFHGFFFQVLDKDGKPERPLAWRDTVDVPYDQTLSFIVKYDDRPGMWMFHCHILDHADGGLMGMLNLVRGDSPNSAAEHAQHH
jgi:FtsP/CotA-like multicopper oxidase with cupredoxin domain